MPAPSETPAAQLAPELCHRPLIARAPRMLRFDPAAYFPEWQSAARRTFRQLLGPMPAPTPLNVRVEYERTTPDFHETRFLFAAEPGADVPCHLLIPTGAQTPAPVMLCLQGHGPGMHISLGRGINDAERAFTADGHHDYALQALRQGYAALTLEMRCFGERVDRRARPEKQFGGGPTCNHATMAALLLGRTMVGMRVYDVMRAIDALAHFPAADLTRIACMGHSGGGLVTYYAAALDPRITAAFCSCSICTTRDSIASIDHCVDNYVPGILQYFESADIAGLIAPRPLLLVNGATDDIFPIAGVQEAFAEIQAIYQWAGAPHNARLEVGPAGHQLYPALAWPAFQELTHQK